MCGAVATAVPLFQELCLEVSSSWRCKLAASGAYRKGILARLCILFASPYVQMRVQAFDGHCPDVQFD
jgi:hypothetical protein